MLVDHSNMARAFCVPSIVIIFHILFLLVIMFTNAHHGSVGWRRVLQALGPGFDSQVPQFPSFNFFPGNHVQALKQLPPQTSHPSLPSVHQCKSKGQEVRSTMLRSQQRSTQFHWSTWLKIQMGLTNSIHTLIPGPIPPMVLAFFSFLLFFLLFTNYIY